LPNWGRGGGGGKEFPTTTTNGKGRDRKREKKFIHSADSSNRKKGNISPSNRGGKVQKKKGDTKKVEEITFGERDKNTKSPYQNF